MFIKTYIFHLCTHTFTVFTQKELLDRQQNTFLHMLWTTVRGMLPHHRRTRWGLGVSSRRWDVRRRPAVGGALWAPPWDWGRRSGRWRGLQRAPRCEMSRWCFCYIAAFCFMRYVWYVHIQIWDSFSFCLLRF